MKWGKRWLRRLAKVAFGLVALVAILIAVLHTSWGKDKVRGRIEAAMGKRVNGSVVIRSLDYEFPFGDLRVKGVEIRDSRDVEAIQVDSLQLSMGLWATLTDKLSVESLQLDGVRVRTHITDDGRNSLRGLFIKGDGKGKDFSVRSVRIGDLTWEVSKADGDTISFRDGRVQARLERGEFTEVFLETFEATFSATRGDVFSVEGVIRQDGATLKTNPSRTIVSLRPLQTTLRVSRMGEPTIKTEVSVASGELTVTPVSLDARIEEADLGPLTIGVAEAKLGFERGEPVGHQEIRLQKLTLNSEIASDMLQRELPIGNATADVSLIGALDHLVLTGALQTPEGEIRIQGNVDLTGPLAPTYALSTTTDIEVGAFAKLVNSSLRIGSLRVGSLLPTVVRIALSGQGLPSSGGSMKLELQGLRTIAGTLSKTVSMKAHKEGDSLHVDSLKLNVLGTELEGKGSVNLREDVSDVSAKFTLQGNAKEALAQLEALGLRVSPPLHLPSEVFLDLSLSGTPGERMVVTVLPSESAIAGGYVRIQGEAAFEPEGDGMDLVSADGSMSVHGLSIRGLARVAHRPAPVDGRISGRFQLKQRGDVRSVEHQLNINLPEQRIEVQSTGRMRRGRWKGKVAVRADGEDKDVLRLEGELPLIVRGGLKLRRRGKMRLDVEVPSTRLSEHMARLPEELQEKLARVVSEAEVALSLHLEGSVQKPEGQLVIAGKATPTSDAETELSLDLAIGVESKSDGSIVLSPTGALAHSKLSEDLLSLSGEVRALVDRRKPKNAELDFNINAEFPKRSLASLSPLFKKMGSHAQWLVGDVSAQLNLSGNRKAQMLEAEVALGADNPFSVKVKAERSGDVAKVAVQTRASELALSELWPTSVPRPIDDPLVLNSDLGADLLVDLKQRPKLSTLALRGKIVASGAQVAVPQSSRVWKNLKFEVFGDGLQLGAHVEAEESDEQVAVRTIALDASGLLAIGEAIQIGEARARLHSEKWLLFGGKLGVPDAPWASLDADLEVLADTTGAMPVIDVTAHKLNYWEPDREIFTHGLESISPKGDVAFVGDANRPVGKAGPIVPVSKSAAAAEEELETGEPKAHIRLHIPDFVSIAKGPLRLRVRGEVEQLVVPGAGPKGQLEIEGGSLTLFAQPFPVVDRKLVFDGGPPQLELTFAESVEPDILRRVSRVSSGPDVKIRLLPLGGGPLISFSGAGNNTMMDTLSLLHTGHGYVLSQPDAPASVTVSAPQGMHPLMIAFVQANVPKLDLLDRFSVWSIPLDAQTTYGQLRHLDATRYLSDGSSRLRLVLRPQQVGRSTSEAQVDKLFVDSKSMSLGVGLRAGSRLGGGAAAFFEWTSED